ncbi:hypothetical protein CYMTET_15864 [Cymbomonas tetramitiformis]|uniref:Uncharacterized protein n=1 Tax=Cymbomonas tetramitiformis TaxID=36881 RepID=A0AAE0L8W8_9CHLO|nr:hypothetical protein CYMTET_15864 [Cymbomonas tetramitiformis]
MRNKSQRGNPQVPLLLTPDRNFNMPVSRTNSGSSWGDHAPERHPPSKATSKKSAASPSKGRPAPSQRLGAPYGGNRAGLGTQANGGKAGPAQRSSRPVSAGSAGAAPRGHGSKAAGASPLLVPAPSWNKSNAKVSDVMAHLDTAMQQKVKAEHQARELQRRNRELEERLRQAEASGNIRVGSYHGAEAGAKAEGTQGGDPAGSTWAQSRGDPSPYPTGAVEQLEDETLKANVEKALSELSELQRVGISEGGSLVHQGKGQEGSQDMEMRSREVMQNRVEMSRSIMRKLYRKNVDLEKENKILKMRLGDNTEPAGSRPATSAGQPQTPGGAFLEDLGLQKDSPAYIALQERNRTISHMQGQLGAVQKRCDALESMLLQRKGPGALQGDVHEAHAQSATAIDQYKQIRSDYRRLLNRRSESIKRTQGANKEAKKVVSELQQRLTREIQTPQTDLSSVRILWTSVKKY